MFSSNETICYKLFTKNWGRYKQKVTGTIVNNSHLCVLVGGGDHLREVDDDWLVVRSDHDVELVEVSVDDSVAGQLDDQVHEVVVETLNVGNLVHVAPEEKKVPSTFLQK